MLDVIPLRYGTAFKKAFSDPEIFSAFVHDVLGIDFHADRIEQEHGFQPVFGQVDIKYDLFAEDVSQRVVVEIQHIREADTFDRFLYYHLIGQAEQIQSAEAYTFRRTVYTLVVLTRLPDEKNLQFDVAYQDSDIQNLAGRKLGAYKHRLVFVNARGVQPTTPPGVRRWLELIEDSLDHKMDEGRHSEAMLQRVIERIRVRNVSPQDAFLLKEEAEWEAAKSQVEARGLREGEARGLREGEARGLREGEARGLREGEARGLREGEARGLREGEARGLREGEARGLREAIEAVAELLGLELPEARRTQLAALDTGALTALLAHLKAQRAWPQEQENPAAGQVAGGENAGGKEQG